MNAVEVHGLHKVFGKITALEGVDLIVPRGMIFGLVGPNGAGKTTLIKILVGAQRPTSGQVRVLGMEPLRERWTLRQQIGYMPQAYALYDDLSARDNISFFSRAKDVADLSRKVNEILAFTELGGRADDLVGTFSGGMQKRVSLACALIHEPSILFLDEPTAAVDPQLRRRSWELFRSLADQGVTLFISTHLMDEALLCDQVAILRRGRLIVADTPEQILATGRTRLIVQQADHQLDQLIDSTPAGLAEALRSFGLADDVHKITVQPESLEEIVLAIIDSQEVKSG